MTFPVSLGAKRLSGPLLAASLVLVGACEYEEAPEYIELPVENLYNTAMDNMEKGFYPEAAAYFEEVERQHPYSPWATKAQLMAAYSLYLNNNYDEAIGALDRFISLHPSHRDVPYAHYLKAMSYYERISDVGRDQKMTVLAQQTLRELISRYPESKYARDAAVKLDLTIDQLAGKEMEIGRYYQAQREYLAAINRFKLVVARYQTTTHAPEALHRLIECYEALGLREEARRTAAVLGHNFPGSEWYLDSYGLVEGVQTRPDEEAWYEFW